MIAMFLLAWQVGSMLRTHDEPDDLGARLSRAARDLAVSKRAHNAATTARDLARVDALLDEALSRRTQPAQ